MLVPAPVSTYLHDADASCTVKPVHRRTTERAVRTEDATLPQSGGQALKRAIHVARERAGIATDIDLAQRAHVSYDTLMNWYADRTVPRPERLLALARELPGTSYTDLMAAYSGTAAEPPPLQETVSELVNLLRPIVEQAVDREARLRAVEAELRLLREQPANGASQERPVPRTTTG